MDSLRSTQTFYLYDCLLIGLICSVNSSQQGSLICIYFAFVRLAWNKWKFANSIARVSLSPLSHIRFGTLFGHNNLFLLFCFFVCLCELPSFLGGKWICFYWHMITDTFAWRMVTVAVLTFKWDQFELKAFRLVVTQINRFMRLWRFASERRRQSSFLLRWRQFYQFRQNKQYLKIFAHFVLICMRKKNIEIEKTYESQEYSITVKTLCILLWKNVFSREWKYFHVTSISFYT